MMDVKQLPSDVFIVIMQYLTARDLAALSQTCTSMYGLVSITRKTAIIGTRMKPHYRSTSMDGDCMRGCTTLLYLPASQNPLRHGPHTLKFG